MHMDTQSRTQDVAGSWTELQRMSAHTGEWTHSRPVAGAGFKAEMPSLNWSKQEAFEDNSRQRNEDLVFKKCLV